MNVMKKLAWRIRLLRATVGLHGKMVVLAAYFVHLSLKITGRHSGSFDQTLANATAFLRNTMLRFGDTKVVILDWDTLAMFSPFWESFMPLWFTPRLGDVVLDIGANVGKYTMKASRMVGELGRVIAIEPHPTNYDILLRNIGLNELRNVSVLNLAAWKADCKLELFGGDTSGHHSSKRNRHLGSIVVRDRSMDHILAELGVKDVAWIKIDVEGSEPEVLVGLNRTIRSSRPRIIVEIFSENLPSVKSSMKDANYDLVAISQVEGVAGLSSQYFFLVPLSRDQTEN